MSRAVWVVLQQKIDSTSEAPVRFSKLHSEGTPCTLLWRPKSEELGKSGEHGALNALPSDTWHAHFGPMLESSSPSCDGP